MWFFCGISGREVLGPSCVFPGMRSSLYLGKFPVLSLTSTVNLPALCFISSGIINCENIRCTEKLATVSKDGADYRQETGTFEWSEQRRKNCSCCGSRLWKLSGSYRSIPTPSVRQICRCFLNWSRWFPAVSGWESSQNWEDGSAQNTWLL